VKALQKTDRGPGFLRLRDVAEPSCGPGQAKIRVVSAGICATDLHILQDEFPSRPPVTLGHEFSGIVEEVGSGTRSVKVGDRVAVLPSVSLTCGHCHYCRTGYYALCDHRLSCGASVDGGFARYCVVREDQLYALPDTVDVSLSALAEPLSCSVQAVSDLAHVEPGDLVVISGPGPVGLLTLQLAKAQGAKVIMAGLGADEHRLEAAKKMGADVVLNVEEDNLVDAARSLSRGYGADFAFECAGNPSSLTECIDSLRKLGTCVMLGIVGRPTPIMPDTIVYKQLTIRGSISYNWTTWQRTLAIMAEGRVALASIVSHRFPLSQWQEAFHIVESRTGLKVLLEPE
jgi:L-iditol 2-dehydrogenase